MDDLSKSIPKATIEEVAPGVAHIVTTQDLLPMTVIPGIAATSKLVDLVVFKDEQSLANNMHMLGLTWLADRFSNACDLSTLLNHISQASILLSTWDKDVMWLATPLEIRGKNSYAMSASLNYYPSLNYLLSCKTTIIYDAIRDLAAPTLEVCPFALDHLMSACELGCSKCSKGLFGVSS